MAFTENSSVKDVLANKRAVDILEKYLPGITKHPMVKFASSFTLKSIGELPNTGLSKDMYNKILAELKTI